MGITGWTGFRSRWKCGIGLALAASLIGLPALGATDETEQEVARLRAEVAALRAEVANLRAAIEAARSTLPQAGSTGEEGRDEALARLRERARAAAGVETAPSPTGPAVGHERNLNRLNPEISMTGDVVAAATGPGQQFDAREFELDLQSALDPFSHAKLTLSVGAEEIDIEEGYVRYAGLLRGLTLRAGKMRQTFGALNRHHLHALPQVDYPAVYESFFGPEGLAQTGLSFEWLLPRGWSTASEITLQVTDGSADLFSGGAFDRLSALAHVRSYWDLSPSTYFEWGLSGVTGSRAPGQDATVTGTDLTLHWQPPARAKYREFTARAELARSTRDVAPGTTVRSWGGYAYVEGLLRRNLYAGLRYDRVFDPTVAGRSMWSLEPYLSWWQSEFVRLRLAYERRHDPGGLDDRHRLRFQLTWAAGPHKHESY